MIPCSSKSKILQILLHLELIFQNTPRLQMAAQKLQPSGDSREPPTMVMEPMILYLEYMSRETIDVAKSHTSYMLFKDNT